MKDIDFAKIFDSMKKNEISEVIIKEGGKLYEIRRGGFKNMAAPSAPVQAAAPAAVAQPGAAPLASTSASTGAAPVEAAPAINNNNYFEITSPLVGTFYAAPKEGAAPFVEIGDKVTKGQTLCIVEAMKNFNEIESEVDGIVKEICIKNSELIEFGQVIFRIEQQ